VGNGTAVPVQPENAVLVEQRAGMGLRVECPDLVQLDACRMLK
jgi:hypothetical protein